MVATQFGFESIVSAETMEEYKKWFAFGNFVVVAAVLYGFAKLLEKIGKPKIVVEKETGNEIIIRRVDSLFFVPARFWPYIVLAFGVLILFGL